MGAVLKMLALTDMLQRTVVIYAWYVLLYTWIGITDTSHSFQSAKEENLKKTSVQEA